jgi:hypothetical protein
MVFLRFKLNQALLISTSVVSLFQAQFTLLNCVLEQTASGLLSTEVAKSQLITGFSIRMPQMVLLVWDQLHHCGMV